MKQPFFLMFLVFCLLGFSAGALGDTGQYEIEEYDVRLAPREDGTVEISYFQKWKVTGGNIPWVTVGTANSDFTLLEEKLGKNAQTIKAVRQRGWSGVKLTLDRDYVAGESFAVEFAVLQKGLFYHDEKGYRLDFIPGWYERGRIGKLSIELAFFRDLAEVSATPEPVRLESHRFAWEQTNMQPGGRFHISVIFPKGLFPKPIQVGTAQEGKKKRPKFWIMIVIVIITGGLIPIAILIKRGTGGGYGGGGRIGLGGTGGIHTRGCVVACACACVACACACACAGGGAAGCDRKQTRTCPLCATCPRVECPLHLGLPKQLGKLNSPTA